jgi:hypothetical protein
MSPVCLTIHDSNILDLHTLNSRLQESNLRHFLLLFLHFWRMTLKRSTKSLSPQLGDENCRLWQIVPI